jgi:hypothetical protein
MTIFSFSTVTINDGKLFLQLASSNLTLVDDARVKSVMKYRKRAVVNKRNLISGQLINTMAVSFIEIPIFMHRA